LIVKGGANVKQGATGGKSEAGSESDKQQQQEKIGKEGALLLSFFFKRNTESKRERGMSSKHR
jgi:hypothetical protein